MCGRRSCAKFGGRYFWKDRFDGKVSLATQDRGGEIHGGPGNEVRCLDHWRYDGVVPLECDVSERLVYLGDLGNVAICACIVSMAESHVLVVFSSSLLCSFREDRRGFKCGLKRSARAKHFCKRRELKV